MAKKRQGDEPEGPWCYTTDPGKRWEYCGVPTCPKATTSAPENPEESGNLDCIDEDQSRKNPVSASAMLTGKFLPIRKVFANPESFCDKFIIG